MLLSQLVEINSKGIVASSVNFGMMEDPQMNLDLCEGFIFNYDPKASDLSTVAILDALRRSYHSRQEANIHLMIQQYGKGKSHFAVALANFFKKPYESLEVQGILHQVEVATSGKSKSIAEGLRLFKQSAQNYLVVCLSGDKGGDIGKQFLQALLKSLAEQGIQDTLAQHTCSEPLRYLENLDAGKRAEAAAYLESIGNPDGDLNVLIDLLRQNNPGVIPTVKNLANQLTGFTPDFNANIDIEAILKDLIANPRVPNILILFDELNYYLQSWAADQIGAGGTALQNITNICESYKSKITLLSFVQIHPTEAVGISVKDRESYFKISSRLSPKDATYNPESSLELVLDNLLIQQINTPRWQEFQSRWDNTLISESRTAFDKRIKIYNQKGWSFQDFYDHMGRGCFPLHPITAYLLCKLDFTQDRTAIQFIKGYVSNFIQTETVEKAGQLNYIYPIALVDTFIENFSNYPVYTHYKKAEGIVAGADDPDELTVLKALFLFVASAENLPKEDREDHEEILATLTGLSKSRLKTAIDKLIKTRDVIYYRPEAKVYRFFEGISPKGIEEDIEEKIKDKRTSVIDVVIHSQSKIKTYIGDETIVATQFVKDNKLVNTDWKFEFKIYSIDGLLKALHSDQTLRETQEKGILAYVLAETQDELQEFRRMIDDRLKTSPIRNQIAVAIPAEETGDLARVLLKIKVLLEKEAPERKLYGVAYEQLLHRWQEQVDKQLSRLLKNCTYHGVGSEKIPPTERSKAQRVVSVLLQDSYLFVPPVDEIDKLRRNHSTGLKIASFVAKQLLALNLISLPLPDKSYSTVIDTVYVSRWGLLKKTSQHYIVQLPTHERIQAAWQVISRHANLQGQSEKIVDLQKIWKELSAPPYGYSEENFVVLLAAWLVYHRKEVSLKGTISISAKKGVSIPVQTKSLKDWADTDILQKPSDFVNEWIVQRKSKLIRRQQAEIPKLPASPIDYDQAQQYLTAVADFLKADEIEPGDVAEVTKTRALVQASTDQINNWFEPVKTSDVLSAVNLESLLELYPKLRSQPPQSNDITVKPTQYQRDRMSAARESVGAKIAQAIEKKSECAESIATESDCATYKAEIAQIIQQITQTPSLPPHFNDMLRNAMQVAERTLLKIQERAKVGEYLLQIQRLKRNLNDDSTQLSYIRTRTEITNLAQNLDDGTEYASQVEQILQDLDQGYKDLTQQIEIWEERSSSVTSHKQIIKLLEEINTQRRRFTEDESKNRITNLQDHLGQELQGIQNKDDAEKLVRAELANIQQKLQRIRDLPETKLAEAFSVYQELSSSNLPAITQPELNSECQETLQGYKVQGNTVIYDKFAKIYNRKLIKPEDFELQQDLLHKSKNLIINVEDFADIQTNIDQALENLELQYQELQQQIQTQEQQAQDQQIMRDIRHYKTAKTNTIKLCEEGIQEIENYRHQLNNPHTEEIDQIIQLIRARIASHQQDLENLRSSIATVENISNLNRIRTEYAKLDFVFNDSATYSTYQQFQEQIQLLNDDLERVNNLKSYQHDSIASCQEALQAINNEQSHLHNKVRFQPKIAELTAVCATQIQAYTDQLQEFRQKVADINTISEAQNLYEKLLRTASRYSHSDLEAAYTAISAEIKLLIELLQITSLDTNSRQSCQAQLDRLTEWQPELTPLLRDRVAFFRTNLEQSLAQILEREQTAAQAWLKELDNQAAQIYRMVDDTQITAINQLLKQIHTEKSQYIELLSPVDQNSLEYIEHQCTLEQEKHKTSQIETLFRQLPRLQRQSLHEKLANYLTEDSND